MKTQGYTLIEVLLVITILAILSSLAILTYRKNTENNRIDKVSLEIQEALEAAMAYRSEENQWPTANKILPNCIPINPLSDKFITTYLPNKNYTSSYGTNLCWSVDSANQTNSLFWVALRIPFSDPLQNYTVARQIAAKLPNAATMSDPNKDPLTDVCTPTSPTCYVRAEIVLPSISANQPTNNIVGMGYCDPKQNGDQPGSNKNITCRQESPKDHYTIQFPCPEGTQGQVYTVPDFYQSAGFNQTATILTILSTKTTTSTCTKKSGKYVCPITIDAKYDVDGRPVVNPTGLSPGSIGVFYIAYCALPTPQTNW